MVWNFIQQKRTATRHAFGNLPAPRSARRSSLASLSEGEENGLEPLAEVEGALLVVEVLHAPHPELLGSLLVVGGEHFCA